MLRNVQTIVPGSSESSRDLSAVIDTRDLGLSGWYRLKIKVENDNLQKVSLAATEKHGRLIAFEAVCTRSLFACYVYCSKDIERLDVSIGKLSHDASGASIDFRKISVVEFAWKSLRSGFLKSPIKFLGYFIDPFDRFLVTFAFPFPHFAREDYRSWIKSEEPAIVESLRSAARPATEIPEICILMPVCDPQPRYLRKAIESVVQQTSPHWRLSIADDASTNPEVRSMLEAYAKSDKRIDVVFRERRGGISAATNSAFHNVASPLVTCLDHDDMLSSVAIETTARHFAENAGCNILFSDEDKIDERGHRFEPYFKPRKFSPELFYSYNYVNHLTVHRAETIRRIGGWRSEFDGAQDYDLLLRSLKDIDLKTIQHIPLILYHWRAIAGSVALDINYKPYAVEKGRRALAAHFADQPATSVSITSKTMYRIERALPVDRPGVAILVPFRDRPDLLATCVQSILEKTDYDNLELVLIDNGSVDEKTFDLLAKWRSDPRVKIISGNFPFNYSRLNNLGARATDKDYICLLNNDIEAVEPDWLRDMMSYAVVDGVGCVGSKLYYPSGSVQHAGVILGMGGVSSHAFLNKSADDAGYFGRLLVASNYSAVTGACLLVKREVFFRVGGLDEHELPVTFNDIDFCIKVQALGLRNVLTPFANLVHHESASRGADSTPEKAARSQRERAVISARHADILKCDPCYSPHLALEGVDFTIRRRSSNTSIPTNEFYS